MLNVIVLSTCLLYPRDETADHRWGFRDGVDLVVELWLVRAMGNMDLRVQVPGRSYFSIDPVLEPLRHTLWGFWVGFARRVARSCFLLLRSWRAQVWLSPSLAEKTVFYFVCRGFRSWTLCDAGVPLLRHRVRSLWAKLKLYLLVLLL